MKFSSFLLFFTFLLFISYICIFCFGAHNVCAYHSPLDLEVLYKLAKSRHSRVSQARGTWLCSLPMVVIGREQYSMLEQTGSGGPAGVPHVVGLGVFIFK